METAKLPTAAKVFGILHCVFGGFGLVVSPINFFTIGIATQMYEQMGMGDSLINWMKISIYLAPIFALITVILGVGLLMKKPWGHQGAVIYAIFMIGFTLISSTITTIGMVQLLGTNTSSAEAAGRAIGGVIGGVFGGLAACIYPALLLFFLTRPVVKDFYARYQ